MNKRLVIGLMVSSIVAMACPVTASADSVDWCDVVDIPAGFADGVDDVGGLGDGHSLDAVDGDPTDAVYVDIDGKVGVGTTSPTDLLDLSIPRGLPEARVYLTPHPITVTRCFPSTSPAIGSPA